MRISIAQLCIAVLFATFTFATGKAQEALEKEVTIKIENVKLRAALAELEKLADTKFAYSPEIIHDTKLVSLHASKQKLRDILASLLNPMGISYELIADRISLFQTPKEGKTIVTSSQEKNAQPVFQITGQVLDETSQPLAGVNVLEKGTTNGTNTDAEGKYTLSVSDQNAVILFSFIGYTPQEIAASGRTEINVSLLPDLKSLEEVVVVAYGTQKKSSLVAAISSVSSKDITALPVPSMEQALQGRVPGVQVTNNGGPGETPIVRLRGINSINYASNPLYVVDGIPSVSSFNNFDSKDIESIEVLKDASAAALYGSRASAGVILVTTKKGSKDGKLHISLDSYVGTQSAWKTLDLLNTDQYVQYGTQLLTNAGAALPSRFSNLDTPINSSTSQTYAQTNTDWQKAVFRSALISQTQLAISGGTDKSKFYISGGYFKQDGIMVGTGYERYNLRVNSEHKLGKAITFGQTLLLSSGFQKVEPQGGGRTQIKHMLNMAPYISVFNPDNIGGYNGPSSADGQDAQNPVRLANQDLNQITNTRVLGTLYLEATITSWLKFRSNIGLDYSAQRQYQYNPIYTEGSYNARTVANVQDQRTNYFSPVYTNQLTFDKIISKHHVNALGAIEYQTGLNLYSSAYGEYSSNTVKEVTSGSTNQSVVGSRNEFAIYSYIGRVNYEYNDRYLVSLSIRRDGASNFAPGHKFENFPSVGLGWRISEEEFMKNIPAISELKVRGSWGKVGLNANALGNYPWQATINTNITAILAGGTNQGAYTSSLENKNLQWEITTMKNVGIDLGLLNNKVTFSAELYERNSDNQVFNLSPATSTGYTSGTNTNIGGIKSWGYEFVASFSEQAKALKWNVSANMGITRNQVTSLAPGIQYVEPSSLGSDYGDAIPTRTETGQAVQSFYGWKTDGIYQTNAEASKVSDSEGTTSAGDIRFKDTNNDGKIDTSDKVYLGSFLPKFNYGINLSANYKGFDISAFFQGVQGNKVYDATRVLIEGGLRLFNASTTVLNGWTSTNTNTETPRNVNGDPHHNTRMSDRFLEDGSYLRLKNLSIGYNFPQSMLQTITRGTLTRVRLYVSGQNLLTFTSYKGYDPEVGSRNNTSLLQGVDQGQYPSARSYMVGIQAGF